MGLEGQVRGGGRQGGGVMRGQSGWGFKGLVRGGIGGAQQSPRPQVCVTDRQTDRQAEIYADLDRLRA